MTDFVVDLQKITEVQRARLKLLENREWFERHFSEVQRDYKGKIVAINDGQIIAWGMKPQEVKEAIKGKYPMDEVLMILVPIEAIKKVSYAE